MGRPFLDAFFLSSRPQGEGGARELWGVHELHANHRGFQQLQELLTRTRNPSHSKDLLLGWLRQGRMVNERGEPIVPPSFVKDLEDSGHDFIGFKSSTFKVKIPGRPNASDENKALRYEWNFKKKVGRSLVVDKTVAIAIHCYLDAHTVYRISFYRPLPPQAFDEDDDEEGGVTAGGNGQANGATDRRRESHASDDSASASLSGVEGSRAPLSHSSSRESQRSVARRSYADAENSSSSDEDEDKTYAPPQCAEGTANRSPVRRRGRNRRENASSDEKSGGASPDNQVSHSEPHHQRSGCEDSAKSSRSTGSNEEEDNGNDGWGYDDDGAPDPDGDGGGGGGDPDDNADPYLFDDEDNRGATIHNDSLDDDNYDAPGNPPHRPEGRGTAGAARAVICSNLPETRPLAPPHPPSASNHNTNRVPKKCPQLKKPPPPGPPSCPPGGQRNAGSSSHSSPDRSRSTRRAARRDPAIAGGSDNRQRPNRGNSVRDNAIAVAEVGGGSRRKAAPAPSKGATSGSAAAPSGNVPVQNTKRPAPEDAVEDDESSSTSDSSSIVYVGTWKPGMDGSLVAQNSSPTSSGRAEQESEDDDEDRSNDRMWLEERASSTKSTKIPTPEHTSEFATARSKSSSDWSSSDDDERHGAPLHRFGNRRPVGRVNSGLSKKSVSPPSDQDRKMPASTNAGGRAIVASRASVGSGRAEQESGDAEEVDSNDGGIYDASPSPEGGVPSRNLGKRAHSPSSGSNNRRRKKSHEVAVSASDGSLGDIFDSRHNSTAVAASTASSSLMACQNPSRASTGRLPTARESGGNNIPIATTLHGLRDGPANNHANVQPSEEVSSTYGGDVATQATAAEGAVRGRRINGDEVSLSVDTGDTGTGGDEILLPHDDGGGFRVLVENYFRGRGSLPDNKFLASLVSQVEDHQAAQRDQAQIERLQERLQTMQGHLDETETKLKDVTAKHKFILGDYRAAQTDFDRLMCEADNVIEGLQNAIQALNSELVESNKKSEKDQEVIAALEVKSGDLEKSLTIARDELQEAVLEFRAEISRLQKEIQNYKNAPTTRTQNSDFTDESIWNRNETVNAGRSVNPNSHSIASPLDRGVERLVTGSVANQGECGSTHSLMAELESLESKLKKTEDEKMRLEAELMTTKREQNEARTHSVDLLVELQEARVQLKRETNAKEAAEARAAEFERELKIEREHSRKQRGVVRRMGVSLQEVFKSPQDGDQSDDELSVSPSNRPPNGDELDPTSDVTSNRPHAQHHAGGHPADLEEEGISGLQVASSNAGGGNHIGRTTALAPEQANVPSDASAERVNSKAGEGNAVLHSAGHQIAQATAPPETDRLAPPRFPLPQGADRSNPFRKPENADLRFGHRIGQATVPRAASAANAERQGTILREVTASLNANGAVRGQGEHRDQLSEHHSRTRDDQDPPSDAASNLGGA